MEFFDPVMIRYLMIAGSIFSVIFVLVN